MGVAKIVIEAKMRTIWLHPVGKKIDQLDGVVRGVLSRNSLTRVVDISATNCAASFDQRMGNNLSTKRVSPKILRYSTGTSADNPPVGCYLVCPNYFKRFCLELPERTCVTLRVEKTLVSDKTSTKKRCRAASLKMEIF